MRTSKAAVFALVAFELTLAGSARATPNFPPFIQQDLGLAAEPHCAICHSDGDTGGLGTVNTPFGKNMRQRGLVHFDTGALKSALDQMTSGHVNSAGDCLDDIDELKAGRDPNVPDDTCDGGGMITASAGEGPSYGCGIAPPSRGREGLLALPILFFMLKTRRKRVPLPPAGAAGGARGGHTSSTWVPLTLPLPQAGEVKEARRAPQDR